MTQQEMLLAVVGALGTAVIGLLFWFIQQYFSKKDDDAKEVRTDAKMLAKELSELKVTDAKIGEALKALCKRSEEMLVTIGSLKTAVDESIRHQAKVEGRLDEHMNLLTTYIQTMGHMSRQIEALFRYTDAPKRASDRG